MENYDDLVFEPKMTWNDLVAWIKEKKASFLYNNLDVGAIAVDKIVFCYDGRVYTNKRYKDCNIHLELFKNKTPNQMKNIIQALLE